MIFWKFPFLCYNSYVLLEIDIRYTCLYRPLVLFRRNTMLAASLDYFWPAKTWYIQSNYHDVSWLRPCLKNTITSNHWQLGCFSQARLWRIYQLLLFPKLDVYPRHALLMSKEASGNLPMMPIWAVTHKYSSIYSAILTFSIYS